MYEIFDRLLQERGLTVYRVAKDTGLNAAMFTSWKKGDYTPKQDKLSKIAAYFGVSLDYLMTGEDRTPEQVINKVFSSLETTGKPKDTFIVDIQKDTKFMEQIRLLWSLPADRKNEVYKNIAFQLYEIEKEQKEKESSLRA